MHRQRIVMGNCATVTFSISGQYSMMRTDRQRAGTTAVANMWRIDFGINASWTMEP